MATTNLSKNLKSIFETRYYIPLYQRNYAWGLQEIAQLLEDLYESFVADPTSNYYIGSLVVLKRKSGDWEVIDGQQRLTTITLLAKLLNIDFAKEPKLFYDSRPEVEAFFNSFYNSNNINEVTLDYKISHLVDAIEYISTVIINPKDKIPKTILDASHREKFNEFFAKNVYLVKVEIPADTDVANYFEIMNNRGEQLQMTEIIKARLMNAIRTSGEYDIHKQKIFSRVWDACSQMKENIQKSFEKNERVKIFGTDYSSFNGLKTLLREVNSSENINQKTGETINQILVNSVIGESSSIPIDYDDIDDDGKGGSIIDFPNFLMHVLKIEYNKIYIDNKKNSVEADIPLNEKDLLKVYGSIENSIEPIFFIEKLLFYRTVFDRFIPKAADDDKAEDFYKWILEKPYRYSDTKNRDFLKYKNTYESQEVLIKQLSLLQVTFRTRKYKNWLQDVLNWFKDKDVNAVNSIGYSTFLNMWLLNYYATNINGDIWQKGTNTPHFLFNFIDYLLWFQNKQSNKFDFEFKYRNSVEHHLPQSQRSEKDGDWIDSIGNLCLVSKGINSRMNNESPIGKADSSNTGKYYKNTLPPKQLTMYNITNKEREWGKQQVDKHASEIITLLNQRVSILNESALNIIGTIINT